MISRNISLSLAALFSSLIALVPPSQSVYAAAKPAAWVKVSPKGVSTNQAAFNNANFGFQALAADPKTGAMYVGTCYQGLWKSTDQGRSWAKVNTGQNGNLLDSGRLWALVIDPVNPRVIYTTAGYGTGGILKSTDGGVDWTNLLASDTDIEKQLQGFDVYSIALDPRNHEHLLASFHGFFSGGSYGGRSPIIESTNAGADWTIHTVGSLSYPESIHFLNDSSTWLLGTTDNGLWRTTNAGKTWQQVSRQNATDGQNEAYRSSKGDWYLASFGSILRSKDNGRTWAGVGPTGAAYMGIVGDGRYIYTAPANGNRLYFMGTRESDGSHWAQYNTQAVSQGPMSMAYDQVHHLVYSSNWRAGVWKLDARKARLPSLSVEGYRALRDGAHAAHNPRAKRRKGTAGGFERGRG